MTEPNGLPPVTEPGVKPQDVKIQQYLVLWACDVAGNLLATLANGLHLAHHLESAAVFKRLMDDVSKYRDGYLRRVHSGLVIAGANEVPKLKG